MLLSVTQRGVFPLQGQHGAGRGVVSILGTCACVCVCAFSPQVESATRR